jgi:hypothetical protein
MGIEEEEVHAKNIENIFNEIIAENFPNPGKEMDIQIKKAFRTPDRHDQKRTCTHHIIVKTLTLQSKEAT